MKTTRRTFLKTATALSVSAGLMTCSAPKRKPNIILIMADDLGYGDLGCYGSDWINTPHIDRLAANGLLFTDYHSNGAVCTPTRAALLTGRYQQRSLLEGVIYVGKPTRLEGLDTSEYTFAEALKTAGYKTACIGKWHLGYEKLYNPVFHGFDEFRGYVSGNIDYISHFDNHGIFDWWHNLERVEEEGYCTDLLTRHAVNFIQDHKDEPFCLYVAHEAPHWPYQGRTSSADRYPGSQPPDVPGRGLDPNPKARFKEMIQVMDEGIGEILNTVESLNLQKDTLIFFCSDNGGDPPWASNGHLRGNKGQLWEGGHRVPAIACWPGKIVPGETDELVMSMDVFPTMCSIGGVTEKPAQRLDGVDFSGVLFDGQPLEQRDVFWRYRKQKAVRRGQWKLLIDSDQAYLFDLNNDMAETVNLIETHSDIADELRQALQKWESDVPSIESQKTT
jgi:arylsulfatase A-like enzyme